MGKFKYDWDEIKARTIEALKSCVIPEYERIAKVVGVPVTSLKCGLRNHCGIENVAALQELCYQYRPGSTHVQEVPSPQPPLAD